MSEKTITCLNGDYLPANEARVSLADRGFRFGDGVFESIRLVAGVPYQWELHQSRLLAGLAALRIAAPAVDWQAVAREVIRRNQAREGTLRIAVSRGVGSVGYLPAEGITATWAIEYQPALPLPLEQHRLWVSSVTRPPLSALPVNFKLAHGLGSTLALLEARDQGCGEAIILTTDGKLCEAASANLFWIVNQKLYTPALSTGCLSGSTRAAVLRLASVEEVTADVGALHSADAIFLTNARRGIAPADCARFKVQGSATHPLIVSLAEQLEADREAYARTHRVQWA